MDSIAFRIDCIPPKSTHQASLRIMKRRDGTQFVGKMATSKGKATQNELIALVAEHRPAQPFAGPVRLLVEWDYPWRKSESKKSRLTGFRWCDTRPDCDNIVKLLKDVLTRLNFWGDDSQVADLIFKKRWCDKPGIGIQIVALEE
ncbi:MAG: RusA family crossover junction endodeoxyribonuclease [bacterium]